MNYMKNRILSMLVLLITAATGAWADGSGDCGSGVTWSLSDGVLTISKTGAGTGKMTLYEAKSDIPWNSSASTITSVTIGDGVTYIGYYAFCDCTNLTTVTIPSSMTGIGNYAFQGCTGLETVTVEAASASLGADVFIYYDNDSQKHDLPNLTAIYVPADKVDTYKTNWSNYAALIQASPDLTPDATGKVWTLASMPAYNVQLVAEY